MKKIACFSSENLQALADILGDTNSGLTGSEIGVILAKCNIEDVDPQNTKGFGYIMLWLMNKIKNNMEIMLLHSFIKQ